MMLRRALLGALLLPLCSIATAEPRPFTVDLMLKNEGIAEVMFSPRGDRVLIEKTAAYESAQQFGGRSWGRERSALMVAEGNAKDGAAQLVANSGEKLWLQSFSPSGARAAVGWFDGDVAKLGIYELASGKLRKLDLNTSFGLCTFDCPLWFSDDEFVHIAQATDTQKKFIGYEAFQHELMDRWSRQSWRGGEAAVSVYGSGKFKRDIPLEGKATLLRVNAVTGTSIDLLSDVIMEVSLSPDRRRLAILRDMGDLDMSGMEVQAIMMLDRVLRLEIFDLANGARRVIPCEPCNATYGSLRWSPSGTKLFFGARTRGEGKLVHEHYIYDFKRGAKEKFAPQGLAFESIPLVDRGVVIEPFAWLTDDTPAVRITKKSTAKKAGEGKDQHEWFAVPKGGKPVSLTAGLTTGKDEKPLEDYVAVHKGKLLMTADGELWQLSPNGTRKNLTQGIEEPVSAWCSVISYWREVGVAPECEGLHEDTVMRTIDADALAKGWVTLRVLRDGAFTGDLIFLNIDSGEKVRVTRPGEDAHLITASALGRAAIYNRKGADGDRLLLAAAGQPPRELLHINQHLAGVGAAKPILLTRRDPGESEDRYDWLLLPPTHKPGDRHPLLVYFYPDTKYRKEFTSDDLRAVSFLNQNVPAGRGFAVLLATMKISTMEARGNPMTEMHEQLVRAAENVAAQGYADPERWAIMGHSYGGYGTNSVITQTNRFKAAIAMAGPVNLTSAYAIGLSSTKANEKVDPLSFGVLWSEGGQGRMGMAPWQDPQRYLANSPLFHVDKVQTPLMLVYGENDFVDVNEGEQMFNALNRQGKDAVLVRYWGEGHVIESPANIRDLWRRATDWFDQHLDIARDSNGDIIMDNHRIRSRGN